MSTPLSGRTDPVLAVVVFKPSTACLNSAIASNTLPFSIDDSVGIADTEVGETIFFRISSSVS
jgi:hypothetical protein